jgi:hypothetical protein
MGHRKRIALGALGAAALSLLGSGSARADVVTHFGTGVGPLLGTFLDDAGIGAANTAAETTATSFFVPGASGTNTTLTFHLASDNGTFNFQFGYFNTAAVSANPLTDPVTYATQALSASTLVFDDVTQNPPDTATFSVAAGTNLGFFIVPNNTIAAFLANPALFYPPTPLGDTPHRSPLFSLSDANPGQFDQMLAFAGNGKTLFAFEDLTRVGSSDQNFTDLIFTLDAQLAVVPPTPVVPLPAAAWGGLLLLGGLGAKRVRAARLSTEQ